MKERGMLESEVQDILLGRFGGLICPSDKLAALFPSGLSLEGYIRWLGETEGPANLDRKIPDAMNIAHYQEALTREIRDLPRHLVNAGKMYQHLTDDGFTDMNYIVNMLGQMTMRHVVYLLMAGGGFDVPAYAETARNYCVKFPQAVLSLPEPYASIGKAMLNDSIR